MSNLPAVVDSEAFEHIKKVADLYVQGVTSPFTLGRRLNMKVTEVRTALEQWHLMIQHDEASQDAAREALDVMLQRYDVLLVEANDNLTNLKTLEYDEKISAQINATIKAIADLDKTRVDLLQKAGMFERGDLGDELAEREEREAMILKILREDLCGICRDVVRDKISYLTGQVQGDVIDAEVVHEHE